MMKRYLILLAASLLISIPAQAHRFAPSLLKVTETGSGEYNLVWKTPLQAASSIPLRPQWPESCEVASANPPQVEGTGRVFSWRLSCTFGPDGLVGQELGISGLAANQASAMVMVSLLDGRNYQEVLNTEQTSFVVPEEPGTGEVMTDYSVLGMEAYLGWYRSPALCFRSVVARGRRRAAAVDDYRVHRGSQHYAVAGNAGLL